MTTLLRRVVLADRRAVTLPVVRGETWRVGVDADDDMMLTDGCLVEGSSKEMSTWSVEQPRSQRRWPRLEEKVDVGRVMQPGKLSRCRPTPPMNGRHGGCSKCLDRVYSGAVIKFHVDRAILCYASLGECSEVRTIVNGLSRIFVVADVVVVVLLEVVVVVVVVAAVTKNSLVGTVSK